MNENVWAITAFVMLIAALWGSAIYGESTTKPLWVIFVSPAIAVEFIIVLAFAIHDPWPPKSSNLMFYAAAYLPAAIMFGLLSYGSARRARRPRKNV
jgi:hypothetical protein